MKNEQNRRLLLLKQEKVLDPNDQILFSERRDSMSFVQTVLFILNVGIGTGVMRLGSAYRAGAILSPLLSTVIAILSTYSFFLFLKAAAKTKASTFEGIWSKTFGSRTVLICASISMLSKLMALKTYVGFVIDQLKYLIKQYSTKLPLFVMDRFFLFACVMVIFYIPILVSKSLKVIAAVCMIKVACLCFLCIVIIYWFVHFEIMDGFDPRDEISYFQFDNRFVSCLNSLLTAYLIMPICYPGLKHFKKITVNSFLAQYTLSMVITWIVYNIVGLICYFTFFEKNKGGLILSYYGDNVLNTVSQVVLTIMMIFTCPVAMNPVRYVLIDTISMGAEFTNEIWCEAGIVIMVIAVLISSLSGDVNFWVGTITNVRSPLVLFIIPAALYMKACGRASKLHFTLAVLILLIGIAATGFVLYLPFMK